MTASVNPLVIEIERLRKQLAAERELHKHATENNLALANVKLATAVEALKRIREFALKTDWKLAQQIDAALAKVKETK